jgi:hypothetical protein
VKLEFFDHETHADASKRRSILDETDLLGLFHSLIHRKPFFFELRGENGYSLFIGIGTSVGCLQHSLTNGDLPYMMAVNVQSNDSSKYLEFISGGTATPVSMRYCLPIQLVIDIAVYFLRTGKRSPAVPWEEI